MVTLDERLSAATARLIELRSLLPPLLPVRLKREQTIAVPVS